MKLEQEKADLDLLMERFKTKSSKKTKTQFQTSSILE